MPAVIDPQISGIAGNMILGALLDLGAKKETLKNLEGVLPSLINDCKQVEIEIKQAKRLTISGTSVETKIKEERHAIAGEKVKKRMQKVCKELKVGVQVKNFAIQTLERLIKAEATVHNEQPTEVHLHETGSVDTIVDILGTGLLLRDINAFDKTWYTLPVAVGKGKIKTAHGNFISPAPATLEILRSANIPLQGIPVNSEIATPTGVALLAQLSEEPLDVLPSLTPQEIGYGLGSKNFSEVPNILRIVVGSSLAVRDEVYVLETNLDDVTGEVLGHTINRLLEGSALDVTVTPTVMKKNRPGYILKVITKKENLREVSRNILQETGSIGVRFQSTKRYKAKREIRKIKVEVRGRQFEIPVKISRIDDEILNLKAEYDHLEEAAHRLDLSLRQFKERVEEKAKKKLRRRGEA